MSGIAAVVALDLGFTMLVGSENQPSVAFDSPITRSTSARAPDLEPNPVESDTSERPTVAQLPARRLIASRTRLNSPRRDAGSLASRRTLALDQPQGRLAAQPRQRGFAPITIRYSARSPVAFRPYVVTTSENISYASADVNRPKHDSLASKFSPLVKKPLHVMKSLVAKLR